MLVWCAGAVYRCDPLSSPSRSTRRISTSEQINQVARRIRRVGLLARTVRVKLRYSDFRTVTRAVTLTAAPASTAELWRAVRGLLGRHFTPLPAPVRLIGAGVSVSGESRHSRGLENDR